MLIALQILGFLLATLGFGIFLLSFGTAIYNAGYVYASSLKDRIKKTLVFLLPAGMGLGVMFFGIWLILQG